MTSPNKTEQGSVIPSRAFQKVLQSMRDDLQWYKDRLTELEDRILSQRHEASPLGLGGLQANSLDITPSKLPAVFEALQTHKKREEDLELRLRETELLLLEAEGLAGRFGNTTRFSDVDSGSPSPQRRWNRAGQGSDEPVGNPDTWPTAEEINYVEKYERLKGKYHRQRERFERNEKLLRRQRYDSVLAMYDLIPKAHFAFFQPSLHFPSLKERAQVQGISFFGPHVPQTEVYRSLVKPFLDLMECGLNSFWCVRSSADEVTGMASQTFLQELCGFFLSSMLLEPRCASISRVRCVPFQPYPNRLFSVFPAVSERPEQGSPEIGQAISLLSKGAVSFEIVSREGHTSVCTFSSVPDEFAESRKDEFFHTLREASKRRMLLLPSTFELQQGSWLELILNCTAQERCVVNVVGVGSPVTEGHEEFRWLEGCKGALHPLSR